MRADGVALSLLVDDGGRAALTGTAAAQAWSLTEH
jgi:hypothetical protein